MQHPPNRQDRGAAECGWRRAAVGNRSRSSRRHPRDYRRVWRLRSGTRNGWSSRCPLSRPDRPQGAFSPEAATVVQNFVDRGVKIVAEPCDVSDRTALERLFEKIRSTMPPVVGIMHAAMVLDDAILPRSRRGALPRVLGAEDYRRGKSRSAGPRRRSIIRDVLVGHDLAGQSGPGKLRCPPMPIWKAWRAAAARKGSPLLPSAGDRSLTLAWSRETSAAKRLAETDRRNRHARRAKRSN